MTFLPELLGAVAILLAVDALLMILASHVLPQPWRDDLKDWMDKHL